MPFRVAVVGKPRDLNLAAVIEDYEQRAARYWQLSFHEVKAAGSAGADPVVVRRKESDALLKAASPGAQLVACDESGKQLDSRQFSAWLTDMRDRSVSCTFLVGGAFGLDESLRNSAHMLLSFSRFTLPHEVARMLLAEQLYRAGTIMRGEPYHK